MYKIYITYIIYVIFNISTLDALFRNEWMNESISIDNVYADFKTQEINLQL